MKIGDKVKYGDGKGKTKEGLLHGISKQADGKTERIVSYMVDHTPKAKKGEYVEPVIVTVDADKLTPA